MWIMIILLAASLIVYCWLIEWESEHVDYEEQNHPACQTCIYYDACKKAKRLKKQCNDYEKV